MLRPSRIAALDVVRGFAAFGIFVVNVQTFGGPYPLFEGEPFHDLGSQMTYALVDALFVSKFFPLFSLLFGVGLSMQIDAEQNAGRPPAKLVARRLVVLLGIGLAHVAFLSTIDILVQYALLGGLVLVFARMSTRALVGTATLCFAVPVVLTSIAAATGLLDAVYVGGYDADSLMHAYGRGTMREFFAMRALEIRDYYAWFVTYAGWESVGMMAFGQYAVRKGLVRAPDMSRLARIARRAAAIGFPAACAHAALFMWKRDLVHPSPALYVLSALLSAIGEPAVAITYAAVLARAAAAPVLPGALVLLEGVGRMALTSYVFQSVVMGLVFFTYGLGLYGTLGPIPCTALVVVLFVVELGLAQAWLARYELGPMEYLWRRLVRA